MTVAPAPDLPFDLFDQPIGAVLRAAHEAIVMIDEGQKIVAMNPAAEQMFGCGAEACFGQLLARFIPAAHRSAHADKARQFNDSPTLQALTAGHRRTVAQRADGSEFPIEIALSPVQIMTADGPRRYHAALVLDMSEQSRLRTELERFKRRLRSVFELAPVAIWISDHDRIVFANQAAARLFDRERSIVGQSLWSLLDEGSHADLRRQLALALGGERNVALAHARITGMGGESREVDIAVAALPDHGGSTVQMAVADVTAQRRETAQLEHSRGRLRELSTSVVEAREEERRRIARELHDELGQRLTAMKMALSALGKGSDAPTPAQCIDEMMQMLDETIASVRRISADLRPMMLDELGLNAAIEWLAGDVARRTGMAVTVRLGAADPPVDERLATAVFRMVQEALTNVARHAGASEVRVSLQRQQRQRQLVLQVDDNGIGYPAWALQADGSYGLLGMQERAAMFGGHLELTTPPGGGARLTVRLPLPRPVKGGRGRAKTTLASGSTTGPAP